MATKTNDDKHQTKSVTQIAEPLEPPGEVASPRELLLKKNVVEPFGTGSSDASQVRSTKPERAGQSSGALVTPAATTEVPTPINDSENLVPVLTASIAQAEEKKKCSAVVFNVAGGGSVQCNQESGHKGEHSHTTEFIPMSSPSSHLIEGRPIEARPIESVTQVRPVTAASVLPPEVPPKAGGILLSTKPASLSGSGFQAPLASRPAASAASTAAKPTGPMASLVERVSALLDLDAGKPPASLVSVNLDEAGLDFAHMLFFGPPDSLKTSTAAMFGGPERTAIIVSRRREQLIPLKGLGFKWVAVVEDAEALRYALLFPEKLWPDWAKLPDRVLMFDDLTEGVDILVQDHMNIWDEKKLEWRVMKDGRAAYRKAGVELHDLLKIALGRRQHVMLTAVESTVNEEGTIDYRTGPDIPRKMLVLTETELEFVFYMEPGKNEMLTMPRVVVRKADNPDTKREDVWREITFAKNKLPIKCIGKNVLKAVEVKDAAAVWLKIQLGMKGQYPVTVSAAPVPIAKPVGLVPRSPLVKK